MSTPQQGPQYQPQPGPPPLQQPQYGQPTVAQDEQLAQAQPIPAPPPQSKRFGWLVVGAAAFIALLLGIGIGGAGRGPNTASPVAAPAPTVTITQTAPAAEPSSEEPSSDPTEDTSTDDTYSPKKSDFKLGVKTLSKECFGSAGCNVSFRIKPEYVGDQSLPSSGEIEVSYKITGLQDPVENTFTVDGEGTITYTKEEDGETESKGDKLGAKVTDVEYTP